MVRKLETPVGIEWIDIEYPQAQELEELSQKYKLHHYTLKDCLEPDHLPKHESLENFDFMILRLVAENAPEDAHVIQELTNKIAIFFNSEVLITVHRRNYPFLDHLHKAYVASNKCNDISEIVTKIIWYTIQSYEKPALQLDAEIDIYESFIFRKQIEPLQLETLYFLKRKSSIYKKVLMLTQDTINRHKSTKSDKVGIQDIKDLHLKLLTMFDQAQEDVNNLSSIYLSLSAQKTNDVMKLLTIFSVFFMPLTFIVGVYGMNFKNMPELDTKYGYFFTLIGMIAIAIFIFVWFRRKRLI